MLISGFIIIIIATIISSVLFFGNNEKSAFITFLSMLIAIFLLFMGFNETVIIKDYKNFRDKSYHDYSKDRNYQKWLIDNPKIDNK